MLKSAFIALAAATMSLASYAHASIPAEVYHCSFTEPFFSIDYNEADLTLAKVGPEDYVEQPNGTFLEVPRIEANVTSHIASDGKLEFIDSNGVIRYTLELTGKGSDGMSDAIYPYEAVSKTAVDTQLGQIGGCYSTSHPLIQPAQ